MERLRLLATVSVVVASAAGAGGTHAFEQRCDVPEAWRQQVEGDPVQSARKAFEGGTCTYLGIYSIVPFVPGVDADFYCLYSKGYVTLIEGASLCSAESFHFLTRAMRFASSYNLILEGLNPKPLRKCPPKRRRPDTEDTEANHGSDRLP